MVANNIGSVKPRRKNTNDRITLEALKYYIPLFHIGDQAEIRLEDTSIVLSPAERNTLITKSSLKKLTVNKIASLSGPLITKEINNLIRNSHLNGRDDLFDVLYYAGINGMIKGLRHFDVEKMNKSSTNYLFQWIVTYAKKELTAIEAPFGVAPSRFQRYKKISAVRKKLSESLGRYATNEEVLEFFLSGKADIKTMSGRLDKGDKPYLVNQNMTLELVAEQENFEQNLNHVELLDPLADYNAEIKLSTEMVVPFEETIFGVFLNKYNFTKNAYSVLLSDLNYTRLGSDSTENVLNISDSEYKVLSSRWKDLLRDVNGPFYAFLQSLGDEGFDQFDVNQAKTNIENYHKKIKPERYLPLFEDKNMEIVK